MGKYRTFPDKWDQSYPADGITFDGDKFIQTKASLSTVYGGAVIDNTFGIQTWKLEIMKYRNKSMWFMFIGVVKDNDEWLRSRTNTDYWWEQQNGYGFTYGYGQTVYKDNKKVIREYGETFNKKRNTMQVLLNVNEGTLKYIINDVDYGVAFYNIDKA